MCYEFYVISTNVEMNFRQSNTEIWPKQLYCDHKVQNYCLLEEREVYYKKREKSFVTNEDFKFLGRYTWLNALLRIQHLLG